MVEPCTWIVFHAHPTRLRETKDDHPDFYGTFVCPSSRREPEVLLEEVLSNRKLFLSQIVEQRLMKLTDEWGSNEKLKIEVDRAGYGIALTKMNRELPPMD